MPQAALDPPTGRRPDPCRARWRHSSPRPPPPQRAEGLRLGLTAVPPAWSTLRSASWTLSSSACTGSPLALLERGARSRRSLSHATARAGRSLRPTGAIRRCTGSSRKSRRTHLTLARHRPSLAKSQRACRQSLAWGKRGRAKLARIYHRPINSNGFFAKLSVIVPVLLGHFD